MTNIALNTKLKGMRSSLLDEEELSASSLADVLKLLQTLPAYQEEAGKLSIQDLDRANLEELILTGPVHDFLKLYRFANLEERKALKVYGIRYEQSFLNHLARQLLSTGEPGIKSTAFTDYLDKHRHFDTSALLLAKDITDLANALSESDYAPYFNQFLKAQPDNLAFSFESGLDKFVVQLVWRKADRNLTGGEWTRFRKQFGTEMDLLNIVTLYRFKFIYQKGQAQDFLLPIGRRLNDEVVSRLLSAHDVKGFMGIVESLGYGQALAGLSEGRSVVDSRNRAMAKLEARLSRQSQSTVLALYQYLEEKNREARALVRLTEQADRAEARAKARPYK